MEKKHSETAIFAALYRAVANKEFDDKEIEKAFLKNKNASFLGQIAGFFRFTLASPNDDSNKNPE